MDEAPPLGQEVVVTLADGSELLAYWNGVCWMVGVAHDPIDAVLAGDVIEWRWRDD